MIRTRMLVIGLTTCMAATAALGQGMMVPKDSSIPPLAIKSQQVSVAVENQVATTTVKQVFMNSTSRQLEAKFIFPMPAESTIRDFAMMVDGKRVSGELVEAKRAKEIYTTIVRQARDPGLLEHLGDNLFQVSIFPVPANGTQTVELAYSEVIKSSGGVCRYVYPLKTGSKASRVQDFFSVGLKLKSNVPIKSIYSPSHEIGISRKGDHDATVGLELSAATLDRDFSLYWTVSEKDFGLSAVAFRPDKGGDGYLMLLLAPKSAVNDSEIIAKDVQFVFDTSGSMSGDKIVQARKALAYCVQALNEKDRFNIVTFSTDVKPFKDGLVAATKENKKAAGEHIDGIEAQGGTNIHEALSQALAAAREVKDRPQVIIFLTDGRPTIGTTDVDKIAGVAEQEKGEAVRIFTFGVGNDVNTKLLDRVAGGSGGLPEYVRPGEDIEVKVSDFFAKASHPVMTELAIDFGGNVKVADMLPKSLPDLYHGQQVVAFARYKGAGDVSVTLGGKVSNGKTEKHVYEVSLPEQSNDNDFIEPLWAHRKVGYLLDQIRLNGENDELKNEVIRLSKAYKIQTPYTSYLVLEEQHRQQYLGTKTASRPVRRPTPAATPRRPGGHGNVAPAEATPPPPTDMPVASPEPRLQGGQSSRGDAVTGRSPSVSGPAAPTPVGEEEKDRRSLDRVMNEVGAVASREGTRRDESGARWAVDDADGKRSFADGGGSGGAPTTQPDELAKILALNAEDFRKESGEAAVTLARDIRAKKDAEHLASAGRSSGLSGQRKVAGRAFFLHRGFWVDENFDAAATITMVKWGSDAYFAIVTAHPELKDAFALGENVIIATAAGRTLVVSSEKGEEKLSEEQVKELFTARVPATQPDDAG